MSMKILIFLFAMITFILMASDPHRDDFETRDLNSKQTDTQNSQEDDSEESS